MARRISHLRALEAESIHIFREVSAEFQRPVMLYSVGKDSSVRLGVRQKVFSPALLPFSLMHLDNTYKFVGMLQYQRTAPQHLQVIVRADPWRGLTDHKMDQISVDYGVFHGLIEHFKPFLDSLSAPDEIDIGRRDLLAAGTEPQTASLIEATIVWFDGTPLNPSKEYPLKHTTHTNAPAGMIK